MPRTPDNTWTMDALQRGDFSAIQRRVLDEPEYIAERDFVGHTPLLNAIEFGSLETVRFLLDHGADPDVEVEDGYTCLLVAIESDAAESVPIAAELIRSGADIHTAGIHGWTPLHMAAARGGVEKVRLLIRSGADVNRRTEIDGEETPLMEAARAGQSETVLLLLQHGADPSMRDTVAGWTPLEMARSAAAGPDPEVADLLRTECQYVPDDLEEALDGLGLPPEQSEIIKRAVREVDLAKAYVDGASELVQRGNHAEVIRILAAHR